MRREIATAALAMLLALTPGVVTAGDNPPPPAASAETSQAEKDPVSEALCGRPSSAKARADALDAWTTTVLPDTWQRATREDLQKWLSAALCFEPTMDERLLFNLRKRTLQQLQSLVAQAVALEDFGGSLLSLVAQKPAQGIAHDLWPTAAECSGCNALRNAADAAQRITAQWTRKNNAQGIGAQLDRAREIEPLIDDLCRAAPPQGALDDLDRQFRFLMWTEEGAWLREVAQWFDSPETAKRCRR